MSMEEDKLRQLLKDSGLVSGPDIDSAVKEAKTKEITLGEELIIEGKLKEDDFRRMSAYIYGIPYIDLKGQKIDFAVLSLIPEPIARKHNIIAFKKTNDSLEVAMLDTNDLKAINFVKKKVGMRILPRLTDVESVKAALLQYQKSLKAEFGDIIQKDAKELKMIKEDSDGKTSEVELKKLAEDLPVVRIVNALLNHAVIQGASDIHIEPMETQVLVRYRIDGILHDAMVLPKTTAPGITARVKVLTGLKIDEKRLPQDGRFKIETDNQKVSFRVSTLPTYAGEKIVMRILRDSAAEHSLESLGFFGLNLERIHEATRQKTGLILITGPTGSGKTTCLYTILDILNTPDVNISTIEDPIEYQMGRINQTQVRSEIGLTFSAGLRALVRQDPDVIMVGEIRDNETASLAVNAALTGHLVLSTLHTNSSAGAIPRLLDMEQEPFLLVSTVKVVVAQRLVRRLCTVKEKYLLSKAEIDNLSKLIDMDRMLKILKDEKIIGPKDTWGKIPFYKPKPSAGCETGYKGRQGIYEVMKISAPIRELIMSGSAPQEIAEQSKKEGMTTMLEDGIFKSAQGITTVEEVLRVISE